MIFTILMYLLGAVGWFILGYAVGRVVEALK